MKSIAAAAAGVLVAAVALVHGQQPGVDSLQRAVSIAEIQKTLDAFDIDRTSGQEGERRAADYLIQKLTEYGVKHTRYDARIYMSWPVSAELR